MNKIDKPLLNKQIASLSNQLNKELTDTEREHIEGLLNMLGDIADINQIEDVKFELQFPNGFECWTETHFEITEGIVSHFDKKTHDFLGTVKERHKDQGRGGLYELSKELTDKFEKQNEGIEWDGEFFDYIQAFIEEELK